MKEDSSPLLQEVESLVAHSALERSVFVEDILRLVPKKAEEDQRKETEKLGFALETLITRQIRDCRLIIDICVAIAKITGLPSTKVVSTVQRASKKLNVPSPSWLAKNIRAAKLIECHPEFGEIKDVEKLVSLQRLPEPELAEIAKTGTLVNSEGETIPVVESTRKELTQAVRNRIAPDPEVAAKVPVKPVAVSYDPDEEVELAAEAETEDSLDTGASDFEEVASKLAQVRGQIQDILDLAEGDENPLDEVTDDLQSAVESLSSALKKVYGQTKSSIGTVEAELRPH